MTLLDIRQAPSVCPAFADTFRALGEACGGLLTVEPGEPRPGLLHAARIADDPQTLAGLLAAERRRVTATRNIEPRADVVASRVLRGHAWYTGLMLAGPWFLRRRVPRVALRDVWVDAPADDGGRVFAVAPGTFACLPDDPAAHAPGARVVRDEAALRAELLRVVSEHLAPLPAVFRPHMRRGERVLWGAVTDELISAVWYLGRTLGEGETRRAVDELSALLPGDTPPLMGSAGFRVMAGTNGRTHCNRTQNVCCLSYTLDADDLCPTCPRADDATQIRILEART